ncbi:MAG: hypothetical protein J0I06_03840 [Planctomycetes bacterium]|nr:hypothetical protein [Planctomycetota bacterium]
MPSNAYTGHLVALLRDAEELDEAHAALRTGAPGRQYGPAALNRATVVMCVSAWEAYIEELVRESLAAVRPPGISDPIWNLLQAPTLRALQRFNTPNTDQVRQSLAESIGAPDISASWTWRSCTATRARERLREAMDYRHQVAHGVNPRPIIHNSYSSELPNFFRRLGRCTDNAVRTHLVNTLGIANPWPP